MSDSSYSTQGEIYTIDTWDTFEGVDGASIVGLKSGAERYQLKSVLGAGSGGQVWRGYDVVLEREVAVKIMRRHRLRHHDAVARFEAEALLCGRLNHPNIVTVHDRGVLADGRPFIVMAIVGGQTLSRTIAEVWQRGERPDLASLHRLVGLVRDASEAVAYAHQAGVIHRDLKPPNVMVGHFGEVIVLDWGLATYRDTLELIPGGGVMGTTCYMAPEQARGHTHQIDERTDVFALGAILCEVLTGDPPWGRSAQEALDRAVSGEPVEIPASPELPESLRQICLRALHPQPALRYARAKQLASALTAWLERLDDIQRAQQLVSSAHELVVLAQDKRAQAAVLAQEAHAVLAALPPFAPEADKHTAWAQEDRAAVLRQEAELHEAERVQLLHAALSLDPQQTEAHALLAGMYHQEHRQAEARGDIVAAARLELQLRHHDRGQLAAYLEGSGWWTLITDPPGATVQLHVYEEHHRRLIPVPVGGPRRTPIQRLRLPRGSYLATLSAPGRVTVQYPFSITRQELSHGGMPDALPVPCRLPRQTEAAEGMIYIPAGPFWSGGDPLAMGTSLPLQRLWVDGFWISQHPVTNREFIEFLDDLVAQGRMSEALAYAPRERGTAQSGRMVYGQDASGRFLLVPDADGDTWGLDWPVVLLDYPAIRAFLDWRAARRGRPQRLPYELEWEKAARGADLRPCVWGTDAFDRSWCANIQSAPRMSPAPVGAYPIDISPYGVCGLAGNVSDLCEDGYVQNGPALLAGGRWAPQPVTGGVRGVRGGHWSGHARRTRICTRGGAPETVRSALNGFRIVEPA